MSTEKEMNPAEVEQEEHDSNYQPPPQKTIEEIMAADAEDESLRKYKEALLGEAQAEKIIFGALITRCFGHKVDRFTNPMRFFLLFFQMNPIHGR